MEHSTVLKCILLACQLIFSTLRRRTKTTTSRFPSLSAQVTTMLLSASGSLNALDSRLGEDVWRLSLCVWFISTGKMFPVPYMLQMSGLFPPPDRFCLLLPSLPPPSLFPFSPLSLSFYSTTYLLLPPPYYSPTPLPPLKFLTSAYLCAWGLGWCEGWVGGWELRAQMLRVGSPFTT